MTSPTLAVLLDGVLSAGPAIPSSKIPTLLDALRAELEGAACLAVDGLDAEQLPLRAPKDRISKVLACEEHLVATTGTRGADDHQLSEPVVRGRVLDRLLHHHVHGAGSVIGASAPALAIAEGAFEAERDDELLAWLVDHGDARPGLAEDASEFAKRLTAWGPIDPVWWPRCEDRLRVDLAEGRVVCAAQLDLVVGGAATGRPMVVVEVKSGRFGQDHRDGLFWYAVLAALRHQTPPAAVIAWSAWDGAGWAQPVTEGVLRAAAQRGAMAIGRLGALARGDTPTRTACRACAWCPEQQTCPAAAPAPDEADDHDW